MACQLFYVLYDPKCFAASHSHSSKFILTADSMVVHLYLPTVTNLYYEKIFLKLCMACKEYR